MTNSIGLFLARFEQCFFFGQTFTSAYTIQKEGAVRRIQNLFTLTKNHREIWGQMVDKPELARVLDPAPDINRHPITEAERLFVLFLILHLTSSFEATRHGMYFAEHGLRRDVHEFFALPIPLAPKTRRYRTPHEQLPTSAYQRAALNEIVSFFKDHHDREYAFEKCAAELVRLMDANVVSYDLTRPWRDGGRDATGVYRIGSEASSVLVEFALEAKCKGPRFGSGVKEVSRLISRLRYRQFGVFITTSFLNKQAYCEIIEDGHPVLILAGIDIIALLTKNGFGSVPDIKRWLEVNFS